MPHTIEERDRVVIPATPFASIGSDVERVAEPGIPVNRIGK
jgi:hypothetical protein